MNTRDITNFHFDIAMEILSWLPLKTIFKMKCVSKRWNNFISQPSFQKQYRNSQSKRFKSGFYFYNSSEKKYTYTSDIFNLNGRSPDCKQQKTILAQASQHPLMITAASNGLLLLNINNGKKQFVCDPITKKYVKLPPIKRFCYAFAFVCEINDRNGEFSMKYKVILVEASIISTKRTHAIKTYSSETGKWEESLVISSRIFNICPNYVAKLIKGSFYWTEWQKCNFAVYDPNDIKGRLKIIEVPLFEYPQQLWDQTLCESKDGKVQLIRFGPEMEILVLDENGNDELDIISASFWNLIRRISSTNVGCNIAHHIEIVCVDLVDDHERVIFVNGKEIALFDCRNGSTKKLATFDCYPKPFIQHNRPIWPLLL